MILLLKRGLLTLFSVVFAACFFSVLILSLLYSLLIKSGQHIFSTSLSLLLFSAVVILFFIAVYRFFSKLTRSGLKTVTICLSAVMVLIELAIIVFFHSILPPVIDGGHTYGEALYLLAHGHASGDSYYKVYPNNIPVTVLRYWLYRLFSIIHVSDYTIIDQAACAIVLNIGIYFSWKLVRRLFDAKMANIFLLMTLTCFPLFFYMTYFYTDTMTLMFPALLLYLWYLYHRSMKIRYLFLSGLFLGIGYQIRPNLILFLPALAIYMLFVLKLKRVLLNLIVIAAMIAAVSLSVHAYDQHLGYAPDSALAMPPTHWIMLGLSSYGEYNGPDYALTRSQPTQQAKIQANVNQIKSRIVQKKAPGLLFLWAIKAAITWGMGARGYDIYTRVSDDPAMTAYQYLFNHQDQLMLYITQIFYVANVFFLVLSVLTFFRTKKIGLNLLIQICLFGNFIFYVFLWESEPRYSLLFTPFMILGAVFGLDELMHVIRSLPEVRSLESVRKTFVLIFPAFLLLGVLACAWINISEYTKNQTAQKHYIVDQETAAGVQNAFVDADHVASQTFRATGPFTHVSLSMLNRRGRGVYNFSIMNLGTHKITFSQNFTSAQAKPWHDLVFSMNKGLSGQGSENQITVRQIGGTNRARLGLSLYGNGYGRGSIYSGGHFMENGSPIKNAELRFQVYSIQKKPYLSPGSYFLLFSIPVLMLLFYVYVSLRLGNGKSGPPVSPAL